VARLCKLAKQGCWRDVVWSRELGQLLIDLQNASEARYGRRYVAGLAKALFDEEGPTIQAKLYSCRCIAKAFTAEEAERLAEQLRVNRAFRYSHIRLLVHARDRAKRMLLLQRCLDEKWPSTRLELEVNRVQGGRRSRGGHRPRKRTRTNVAIGVRNVLLQARRWMSFDTSPLGFPLDDGPGVVFGIGETRLVAMGDLPPSLPLTPEMLANGTYHQRRVVFEAQVLRVTPADVSGVAELVLSFGSETLFTRVPEAPINNFQDLVNGCRVNGCRVRICGVLVQDVRPDESEQTNIVYTANPGDVLITAGPPLNPMHLFAIALAFGGGGAGLALSWSLTLRHRVRARTSELRGITDAAHDAILMMGSQQMVAATVFGAPQPGVCYTHGGPNRCSKSSDQLN
jgi:hypothetical protein